MLLKVEIEKLRDSLFTNGSEKEKLFYYFFTKQTYTGNLETPGGDLDKICFAVYNRSESDISKELQRIAPSEPFKHIHYSNSIITLIPVCLKSNDAKSKYLKNYFDTHSFAEKLLLTKIFPDENLQFFATPKTELDKLIDETFFHPQIASALGHLSTAFLEINDLVSLLAFREAYIELLKIHPNTSIEGAFLELSKEVQTLITVVSKRINLIVDWLTFLIFLSATPMAAYLLNKNYVQLHISKYADILAFVSPISIVLIYFGKILFPSVFSFYDTFKQRLIALWFWLRRVNYSRIRALTLPPK